MIIDTHAYLSRWPFRRLACHEPVEFVVSMRKQGVAQAWVGSFDGLLHKDLAAVNERLATDCRTHGAGLIGELGVTMEDERTGHPVPRVPSVDLSPLPEIVAAIRSLRLIVLNRKHDAR